MLRIMGRPNVILKSEFGNIYAIHISLEKKRGKIENNKLTAIQEHLLYCNCSPSFEDFFILTNHFKMKTMESLLIACDKPVLSKA